MRETNRSHSIFLAINQAKPASVASGVIPIVDAHNTPIAQLTPVTCDDCQDDTLLELFTQWRQRYMAMFLTQFTATKSRTQDWLTRQTAGDERILFLLRDLKGQPLGQFGLRNYPDGTVELDNGILGVAAGPARLFYHAERAILRWAASTLCAPRAITRIFSKNVFAIKLHKSLGLVESHREPLTLEETPDGETHYRIAPLGTETDVPFTLVTFEISREAMGVL
jgi:RimJ/RimL family protein N-acetyltransferase